MRSIIGGGPYSTVYKTIDGKVIKKSSDDEDSFNSFQREMGAMKEFSSERVIKFEAVTWEDLQPCITFPLYYCDLTVIFSRTSCSSSGAFGVYKYRDISFSPLGVAKQILEALAIMHEKGFEHCDVKPGNILLDRHGNAVLADLGLSSRFLPTLSSLPQRRICTVGYRPPELNIEAQRSSLGARIGECDIWAVGVTIWELYHQERLFDLSHIPLYIGDYVACSAIYTAFNGKKHKGVKVTLNTFKVACTWEEVSVGCGQWSPCLPYMLAYEAKERPTSVSLLGRSSTPDPTSSLSGQIENYDRLVPSAFDEKFPVSDAEWREEMLFLIEFTQQNDLNHGILFYAVVLLRSVIAEAPDLRSRRCASAVSMRIAEEYIDTSYNPLKLYLYVPGFAFSAKEFTEMRKHIYEIINYRFALATVYDYYQADLEGLENRDLLLFLLVASLFVPVPTASPREGTIRMTVPPKQKTIYTQCRDLCTHLVNESTPAVVYPFPEGAFPKGSVPAALDGRTDLKEFENQILGVVDKEPHIVGKIIDLSPKDVQASILTLVTKQTSSVV